MQTREGEGIGSKPRDARGFVCLSRPPALRAVHTSGTTHENVYTHARDPGQDSDARPGPRRCDKQLDSQPSMAKLAAPGSKQPLQPSLTFHPDSPPAASTAANAYSYADWVAIIEDFNLESSHRVRALEKASGERFQAIERHWTDTFASLDERVKGLSLARFVGEFGSNLDVALAQLVREQVGMRPMGIVEQSARKR